MPIAPLGPVAPTLPTPPVAAPAAAGASDGFAGSLAGAVDQLQSLQGDSDALALKAVTGDLTDIHDATIAAARAEVTMQLAATVRNKGVDAFNEIMRMQA
jgi:flagellar hook-basal body complex protein FliE